ncbi:MAG: c-type cytochrome [Planctomycetia bacterium]|nr:c-type cytochrome [Planctomycetia bacterium]
MSRLSKLGILCAVWFLVVGRDSFAEAQTLDDVLRQQPAAELVRLAKAEGDAARGAVVFFQHFMACSKCHAVGEPSASALGPDLTKLSGDVSDEALVESVLLPSKVIRKGYETVTIQTVDGTTLTGLLVQQTADKVTVRDASRGGKLTTLRIADVEELKRPPLSIMPAGQVNQLAGRQQFYDLIRYLIEIREGGAARARELQPSPALTSFVLPEYEQRLDHRALIRDWNAESLRRGEAIYRRVCANCHGTKDQLGSLPTSLRFAEGKFKNGSDPLTMYQTLTRGFGLMAPQTWMVLTCPP